MIAKQYNVKLTRTEAMQLLVASNNLISLLDFARDRGYDQQWDKPAKVLNDVSKRAVNQTKQLSNDQVLDRLRIIERTLKREKNTKRFTGAIDSIEQLLDYFK